MNKYIVIFYNRFACETQSYDCMAKNILQAMKKFRVKYPRTQFYDCVESIHKL